jgi:prophage maintenance system killer protein
MMRYYLLENGHEITASQKEKYSFIIDISKGNLSFLQIKDWIENNVTKVD